MIYRFTIEKDGKTYECEREVTGTRVLRQTVTVIGFGKKNDPANYGKKWHPSSTMEHIALLIAHEIIDGN